MLKQDKRLKPSNKKRYTLQPEVASSLGSGCQRKGQHIHTWTWQIIEQIGLGANFVKTFIWDMSTPARFDNEINFQKAIKLQISHNENRNLYGCEDKTQFAQDRNLCFGKPANLPYPAKQFF